MCAGVLATTQNEEILGLAFTGPAILNNIRWLTGPYVNHKVSEQFPLTVTNRSETLISEILSANPNMTEADATAAFLSAVRGEKMARALWCVVIPF